MIEKLKNDFISHFGESEEKIRVFFSPSRINIIGEHIDYNGGRVFPCPLEIGTYGIARKNDLGLLRLKSLNIENDGEISIDNLVYEESDSWMNYVKGVVKFIKEDGYDIGGFDLLVYGDIPNGSGLSSSASLELLVGEVTNQLYNNGKISKKDLALIGQRTENKFIGVNTGIMDQFIIAAGKKDHATLIDTASLEYEHIPFDLKDNLIVILNTNYRRELKDSKYNERRSECDEALAHVQKQGKDIENLCELTSSDLHYLEGLEENFYNRAKHAIEENERVDEAVDALKSGDIERLGDILVAGNDSLRELFEVTGPSLDSITKHANDFEDCLGARMTGGGFGGCAISIVNKDSVDAFMEHVAKGYKEDTGLDATFIQSAVGDGVHEIIE